MRKKMKMKKTTQGWFTFVPLAATLALLVANCFTVLGPVPVAQAAADATATVDTNQVLEGNYMGLGVQWEPYADIGYNLTTANWNLITQRLSYMQPGVIRLMIGAGYYLTGFDSAGNPTYNWNSAGMQKIYQELDYAQQHNIEVISGEWDAQPLQPYGIQPTDPRWARIIGDYLNQIHNVKGYTVVKYYNMVNEPNGSWSYVGNWADWKTAITNLYTELNKRGYLSWIKIIGPDSTGADDWVNSSVDQLQNQLGSYELHRYASLEDVTQAALEMQMRGRKAYIVQNDPQGAAKRFFMGEAGMIYGKIDSQDTQPYRYDFNYGVWMGDYIIQSMRAGQASAVAWDLDDAMHTHSPSGYGSLNLKGWGFWNILGGQAGYPASDLNVRPWFYTWSLLSRNFPKGSQTLAVNPTGVTGLRVTSAKIPAANNTYQLSFALVNDSDTPRTVNLVVPNAQTPITLAQYNYFNGDRPADSNGFPVVKNTWSNANLQNGLQVSLPSKGLVILSSIGAGSPIALSSGPTPLPGGTLVDNLDGWDNIYSATANWTFDATNTQYFEGDTSRLKRTTDTVESVTYKQPNITNFSAKVYYASSIANQVKIYASPDNINWTTLNIANDTPISSAGWYRTNFTPVGALPTGTNYLKVEFSNDPNIYTPQLSQITINYSGVAATSQNNLTDPLNDWSKVYGHSTNWTFDATNTQYFEGDTSRLKRTTDTVESITYKQPNISSFSAKVYYENNVANQVKFYASADNANWTTLAVTNDTPLSTAATWYRTNFTPTGALPAGANYLKVEFSNNPSIYTPQLAQISINYGSVTPIGNLALNKPAYASSNETTAFTPNLAVDGNSSTRWSSAWADPQWFYVDLGQVYSVNQVKLNWEAAYAKAYQIQLSTDGTTWNTVYTTYNGAGGSENLTFAAANARYVKMYGIQRATTYGYSLWDFEVYGSGTTPPPATGGLPAHVFAPYTYSWDSPPVNMAQLAQSQGIKYYTLAFMLGNGCQAQWNGNTTFDQSGFDSYISSLRSVGGDVIVSFGGASGTYLEDTCSSVSSLAAQIQAVVDRYNLTYIDFDVENDFGNSAAQTRRAQAIAQVQAHAHSLGKTLKVSFTLGVDTSGLPSDQINVLNAAISNGVDVGLVNIMVMDYGSPVSQMGNAAIQAANSTFSQLKSLFPAKSDTQIWAMLGITPMIGQNDTPGEVFGLTDAQQVMSFAQQNNIGLLAFWALERDFQCGQATNGPSDTCSSVSQAAYAFSNIFKTLTH
jgi:hypothetical protein